MSSTAHLLISERLLGYEDPGGAFTVMIQLGSILAIMWLYRAKIAGVVRGLPSDPDAQRFALMLLVAFVPSVIAGLLLGDFVQSVLYESLRAIAVAFVVGVLAAFLPAAAIGAVLHGFIKGVLFNPWVVCVALILGGFVLLVVDRMRLEARHEDATRFPLSMYVKIGFLQCLAMVPGVSRSGATIVGAMLLGATKRAAAEFSFFLAMPTMAGAFAYDLFKNYKDLSFNDVALIGIGFAVAFVSALFVARTLLDYIARHGFGLFAWWRILVGSAGLAGLLVFG